MRVIFTFLNLFSQVHRGKIKTGTKRVQWYHKMCHYTFKGAWILEVGLAHKGWMPNNKIHLHSIKKMLPCQTKTIGTCTAVAILKRMRGGSITWKGMDADWLKEILTTMPIMKNSMDRELTSLSLAFPSVTQGQRCPMDRRVQLVKKTITQKHLIGGATQKENPGVFSTLRK